MEQALLQKTKIIFWLKATDDSPYGNEKPSIKRKIVVELCSKINNEEGYYPDMALNSNIYQVIKRWF